MVVAVVSQGWEYRGPRRWVEGIPFGSWMESGEHYTQPVGSKPFHEDDVILIPEDKCHETTLEHLRRLRRRLREVKRG